MAGVATISEKAAKVAKVIFFTNVNSPLNIPISYIFYV